MFQHGPQVGGPASQRGCVYQVTGARLEKRSVPLELLPGGFLESLQCGDGPIYVRMAFRALRLYGRDRPFD